MVENMDRTHSFAEKRSVSSAEQGKDSGRSSDLGPHAGESSKERGYVYTLLKAHREGLRGKPLTADEILTIGREAFEPLFHEPPVGPVPEYLAAHLSVHGCVAEYEDKLEELDRWKALQLSWWLNEMVGCRWCVAGRVYELQWENEETAESPKFRFKVIEDGFERDKPQAGEK